MNRLFTSLRFIGNLIWRFAYYFYLIPFEEAFHNLKEFPRQIRILSIIGYTSVAILLSSVFITEIFQHNISQIVFTPPGDSPTLQQIPILALIAGLLAMALSWAFLLTGATDGHPVLFIPIVLLFGAQLLCVMPLEQNAAMLAWCCTAPLLWIGSTTTHLFTYKKPFWKNFQIGEFLIWLGITGLFFLLYALSSGSLSQLASNLSGIFALISFLLIPLWLASGLAVVDAAVDLGKRFINLVRKRFGDDVLKALSAFLIITRPTLALILAMNDILKAGGGELPEPGPLTMTVGLDFFFSLPVLIVAAILLIARRWNARNAATWLAVSIASPAFTLGLVLALGGTNIYDPLEFTTEQIGLGPSLLVFAALIAHSTLSLGVRLSEKDGKLAPRSSRILLGFGLVLSVLGVTLISINQRDALTGLLNRELQTAVNLLFALSVFLFGLPYLLFILFFRRHRLIGKPEEFDALTVSAQPEKPSTSSKWLTVAIIISVILLSIVCLLAILFNQFLFPTVPTP